MGAGLHLLHGSPNPNPNPYPDPDPNPNPNQVYTFYTGASGAAAGAAAGSAAAGGAAAGGGAAAARLRLALGQLEECTDWLLAACDADGRRGAVDWGALRSDEGLAKSEWLVVTILYIYSHA